ncbi:MAG: nuclear transport factor 2 family protein [Acidimicrobiia bacterium]|nr:nuclear transport factor 2 family protein [Acidimicrobiia bacterium]
MTIADIESIKVLKARYFRLMDTKQWHEWGQPFTVDCHVDTSEEMVRNGLDPALGIVDGRDALVAHMHQWVDPARTVHHGHMPEIELVSATEATGVWAMFDLVQIPGDQPIEFEGYGHYHETYEKDADGRWRIARLRLTRLRVENRA